MGTAKASIERRAQALGGLAALLCLLVSPGQARADNCTAKTASGSPFAVCFDSGNRLFVGGGSNGVSGGIRLRHAISFDDEPDLRWKLQHRIAEVSSAGLADRYQGVVYAGRFLRHARDGHIVIPLGVPRKVFLPFDIGAETEVGRLRQEKVGSPAELGVVRVAGLIDLSRSSDFKRRLALGIAASWKMEIDVEDRKVTENQVSPLTQATASGYWESANGLTSTEGEFSGGQEWSTRTGWTWVARAQVSFERVLLAINDKPLSLIVQARARSPDKEVTALVGARFSLFSAKER